MTKRKTSGVNPLRGELKVELGGKTLKTRLDFDGMLKIENELDLNFIQIGALVMSGGMKANIIRSIVSLAVYNHPENKSDDLDLDTLISENYREAYAVAAEITAAVLKPPGVPEGKPKATESE